MPIIETPFTYVVAGKRVGQRAVREHRLMATVAARMPVVERLPVACKATLEGRGRTVEIDYLDWDGRLVRPIPTFTKNRHVDLLHIYQPMLEETLPAALAKVAADTVSDDTVIVRPWWSLRGTRFLGSGNVEDERNVRWGRVVASSRDRNAAAAAKAINEEVVSVGGVIHAVTTPPCWALRDRQTGPCHHTVKAAGPEMVLSVDTDGLFDRQSEIFRADQMGAAFARATEKREFDLRVWKHPVPDGENAAPILGSIEILRPGLMMQDLPRNELMEAFHVLAPAFLELSPETLSEAGEAKSLLRQSETQWLRNPDRLEKLAESLSRTARELHEGRQAAPGMR